MEIPESNNKLYGRLHEKRNHKTNSTFQTLHNNCWWEDRQVSKQDPLYPGIKILLLCICYLNCTKERQAIEETFLASTHISGRLTVDNIGKHMLDLLDSHGIMIKDCCGQACDGASAMSSAVKSTLAVIKKTPSHWQNLFTLGVIV